jgi:hypothetical protein
VRGLDIFYFLSLPFLPYAHFITSHCPHSLVEEITKAILQDAALLSINMHLPKPFVAAVVVSFLLRQLVFSANM